MGEKTIQFDSTLVDVELSFQSYEIYNEEIFDLLVDDRRINGQRNRLQVKEICERRFGVKGRISILIE
jgi:hypothetical protein